MALAEAPSRKALTGHAKPRLSPPLPVRSKLAEFRNQALQMGIALMPWQETAARYLTATGPGDRLLYREVCIVVARQNGKTTLMKPLIIGALRAGKRVMHIAQTRELPRHMFGVIADALSNEPELFPRRRGKVIWPRYGAGQEEIQLLNGGTYRIASAKTGGARGWTNDLVIVDELREMESFQILNAAEPTLTMSPDPQLVYLSNAGTDQSVVLNSVRERAGQDASLAYLEWSAAPERDVQDREGWAEANPALGHYPSVLMTLETGVRKHGLAGTMAIFETEHLCRWVPTMRERLVHEHEWALCATTDELVPVRPYLGISMDPAGKRAAGVLAWQQGETIALRLLFDVWGEPIDVDALGKDIREHAAKAGVVEVGFDPLTDAQLARVFGKPKQKPLSGQLFANASARFVTQVKANRVRYGATEAPVTDDLTWTARKEHDESGSYQAVRADDDRPIPAALAAIRAVWLASGPRPAAPRLMGLKK